MDRPAPAADVLSDDWCDHHFDYLAPEVAAHLCPTLDRMRERHPVVYSTEHGGYWVVTGYEEVLRVAQDWRTFSSAHGVSVPGTTTTAKAIPEHVDPPLHREYKRLVNAWFTPAVVHRYEEPTRALVSGLIDGFIEDGTCEFMAAFAHPLPGLAFFELVLNAPPEEVHDINVMASTATNPNSPDRQQAWAGMHRWITDLVDRRRSEPRRDDVVDAVLHAQIEGRPITDEEIVAVIQLLILGGLDTTAGALGQFMIRFCAEPEIPARLRAEPERISSAVEELLRLEPPFTAIARTAMADVELGGQQIREGEKVLIYWAAANRDPDEFDCPATFDEDRASNRHLTFGAGPHRCTGSTLARMNLRLAVEQLTSRLHDVALAVPREQIAFHPALNRAPDAVPITFTPGPRAGAG